MNAARLPSEANPYSKATGPTGVVAPSPARTPASQLSRPKRLPPWADRPEARSRRSASGPRAPPGPCTVPRASPRARRPRPADPPGALHLPQDLPVAAARSHLETGKTVGPSQLERRLDRELAPGPEANQGDDAEASGLDAGPELEAGEPVGTGPGQLAAAPQPVVRLGPRRQIGSGGGAIVALRGPP